MTMNKLKCSVETCRHNHNDLCSLQKIQVDGPAAMESRETCCGSSASERTDIHCSAERCTYNEGKKCRAEQVNVGCCCSAPCVVSETECCTFMPRA